MSPPMFPLRAGSTLAFLHIIPEPSGTGLADVLGRNKGWVQVTARGLLLLAVVAAAERPAVLVSANARA